MVMKSRPDAQCTTLTFSTPTFQLSDFCCSWSTIQFKCPQQESGFPFGQNGCKLIGTVLFHLLKHCWNFQVLTPAAQCCEIRWALALLTEKNVN